MSLMRGPEWGLYAAVARKLGTQPGFVSRVDRDLKVSRRVSQELAKERNRRKARKGRRSQ